MSAEIIIFEVPEQEFVTNKTQRQLDYEEIQRATKLSMEYINAMYEMAELNTARTPSSLPSIMLKYVIQYCTPLINNTAKYSVSLQNEDVILARDKLSNRQISIPANEQFKVIGVEIPSVFVKNFNKSSLAHYDYASDEVIAQSGRFGLTDQQTMRFTQQRASFTHPGMPNIGSDHIIFTSDEHTMRICKLLISYIEFVESYYAINYPLIRHDLQAATVFGTAPDVWRVVNGELTPSTKKYRIFDKFSSDVLKKLNTAQNAEFGTSFYYDVLYMLNTSRLVKLYNLGAKLSTDDQHFKKNLHTAVDKIKKNAEFQTQLNTSHKTQLDIIKRKNIAFDKFGITDLLACSAAQTRIINLELKKMESKSNESGENNRLLFNKMRIAMAYQTPDELAACLKTVEKNNKSDALNGTDLLQGGVCPHSYQQARIALQHFGTAVAQLQIRQYLIEQFSLPNESAGHFCKICGELMIESDTTGVVRFGAETWIPDDNPIQNMIWKEAMYIISSNIRFIKPTPIKPLVNSIAAGLRDIVAAEEAKLYRSKTTLADEVRDTTNLYAAIYIYAALCAIMLRNPGKMMFARDAPSGTQPASSMRNNQPDAQPANTPDAQPPAKLGGKIKYVLGGKVINDEKLAEKIYIMTALKLIFLSKDTIISRLHNLSADVIKQIFIKNAYAWATKHTKPIHIADDDKNTQDEQPVDTFDRYIYFIERIAPGSKVKSMKDINSMPDEKIPAMYKSGDADLDEYVHKSFASMLEYYQHSVYTKSRVPQHVAVLEYMDKYKPLLELERYIQQRAIRAKIRPNLFVAVRSRNMHDFAPSKIDLANHFCPNGDQHANTTGTYIYTNGKTRAEITRAEITEWLNTNNKQKLAAFELMRAIDERCSKCKTLVRTAKSLKMSDTALKSMFGHIDELTAFYQYYEVRCPKGALHDISTGVCDKCKFNTSFVKARDSEYYEKYKSIFQKAQRVKQSMQIDSLIKVHSTNLHSTKLHSTNLHSTKLHSTNLHSTKQLIKHTASNDVGVDYKYSLKKTAEWSRISDTKYNLLINIGLYEKIKFADLENSTANPSKTAEPAMTRALRIKNHILQIIRDYTMLINHENVVDMPIYLKDFFEAQKKIDIKGFNKDMPNFDDFAEQDALHTNQPIANYINFMQEYLAEIMIRIYTKSGAKYKQLAANLITYFTTSILDKEKFISKPEPVFAKMSSTAMENDSGDEASQGDPWESRSIGSVGSVGSDDGDLAETYENDISHEGFDVENANDTWDND